MKTVRVRIAVAVDANGHWSSSGWYPSLSEHREEARILRTAIENLDSDECVTHWIEADVPIPEPKTIEGNVKPCQPV